MIAYTCDYCGHAIDDEENRVTLSASGTADDDGALGWEVVNGYIGHYHATSERPCYGAIRDAIGLVRECRPDIETIPTISGQAVAARRRKHRRGES